MHYSTTYKNGLLTIPYETMLNYLSAIRELYITLSGAEEFCKLDTESLRESLNKQDFCTEKKFETLLGKKDLCSINKKLLKQQITKALDSGDKVCNMPIESFKYSNDDIYIPLRMLDGGFPPYTEICLSGDQTCATYKNHPDLLMTMLGALEFKKSDQYKITHSPRTYYISEFSGSNKNLFSEELKNFIEMFFKAFSEGRDLEIEISEKLYNLISISSVESRERIEPISINFSLDKKVVEDFSKTKKAEKAKTAETAETAENSTPLKIMYSATYDEYKCTKQVFEFIYRNDKRTKKIALDEQSSKEAIKYLSSPTNYDILREPSPKFFIKVNIPKELSTDILKNLEIDEKPIYYPNFVEITLDRSTCPSIPKHLYNIANQMRNALLSGNEEIGVKKLSSISEIDELSKACNLFLGDYNEHSSEL